MPSQRRPRACFAAPFLNANFAPGRLSRTVVKCCAQSAPDPPVEAPAPRAEARAGTVRVHELEVRAAARSAALRGAEAAETLEAKDASIRDPAALAESLEKEARALRRLDDVRVEPVAVALDTLSQRARALADAAAEEAAAASDVYDGLELDGSAESDARTSDVVAEENSTSGADAVPESIVGTVKTRVERGSSELVRRAESMRDEIGAQVTVFVRDDGTIDFKELRALLGSAVDSAGGVWARLNGRNPDEKMLPGSPAADDDGSGVAFAPVSGDDEQFRLRELINVLERELQAASKAREGVLRREDQLGKLIRAKEIRAMDDSVSAVRRTLAVRVLQLEMEKIFVSLAEEIDRSSVVAGSDAPLMVAEFGELDDRLLEMSVFIDNGEPALVQDDSLGELAGEVQYLKTRLGLDATLYTSTTLDWMQVKQFVAVSVRKTRAGLEFYGRGLRLFVGDLKYAARLVRRAIGGYTPTPREVRTLRRTGRDFFTLIPFTIILIAPLTPVGHVLVFSFLQRYWPDFFPSTFSERRQALMVRYEAYKETLEFDPDAPPAAAGEGIDGTGKKKGTRGVFSRLPLFGRLFTGKESLKTTEGEKEATASAVSVTVAEDGVFVDSPVVGLSDEVLDNGKPSPVGGNGVGEKVVGNGEDVGGNGIAKKPTVLEDQKLVNGPESAKRRGLGRDDIHLAD